jgi:N-acetylglucosamine-6-phosphate deacetylase
MSRGFVDLQVNGYLGIDFSSPRITEEDIRTVTIALGARGTAAYCPTIGTSPAEVYERNLPILANAIEKGTGGDLGIHLEGPFISAISKGAHPEDHIQPISVETFVQWQRLARGNIRLVTLAPELPAAEELIRYLRENGVAVSLGHHFADSASIRRAVAAGAIASTHLGNGLPSLLKRHPNPIWSQLAEDDLWAMCICDGHHLPEEFVKVVLRVKSPAKFVVVSDSAPIAGLPPGHYSYFGADVELQGSGRIILLNDQGLAGSSCTMLDCMNWLASLKLLNEGDLWNAGVRNPLALIDRSGLALTGRGCSVELLDGQFTVIRG